MKRVAIIIFALAMALSVSGMAQAADLVGEWVVSGQSWGAGSGSGHHTAKDGHGWRHQDKQWTLKITEMQGAHSFTGEWCSPAKCEKLVGVVRTDGSILMADEDGYFLATMVGHKMELCYIEAGKDFRIAVCRMMEKKFK